MKKYEEIVERETMFPLERTKKVYVRYCLGDVVIPVGDNLSDSEIDITNASIIGYEDEGGRECHANGIYFDQPVDPNQQRLFDD